MIREAILFEKLEKDAVRCHLCAHRCVINPSRRGICQVRENRDGKLYTHVYGRIIAENIDPIEKKPLYHFQPGSRSYSIATCGCNMSCTHCQNHYISLEAPLLDPIPGEDRLPEDIVNAAEKSGCRSISYTYTEPIIFAEFALDCFVLAHENNMANVFVTNGFLTPEATDALVPGLDAANIDLKGASEEHYRTFCKGRLKPVLESIEALHEAGVWIEITTLLIPGLNDDDKSLEFVSNFIASLDPLIPWHISRFHPTYKMQDRPPTPLSSLTKAARAGEKAGLKYIYMGNVPVDSDVTECHKCGHRLLERAGFSLTDSFIEGEGSCPGCDTPFHGVV